MINLFERFDSKTQVLYKSLQLAGHQNYTIVIHDDGFLPDNITSPYQFFANNPTSANDKSMFFNGIEIPKYWEIEGNNDEAWIKDMGEIRGKIVYQKQYKSRIVNRVEWLDKNGKVRFIDYYTKNGIKFSQTVLDENGKAILKKYMNREGKEVIYENYITKDIVLEWQDKTYFFDSEVAFILFYLQALNIEMNQFVINSLSTPFAVLYNMNISGNDVLFWQEQSGGSIPGNMKLIFNADMARQFKIIVPEHAEHQTLTNSMQAFEKTCVFKSGYLYDYVKRNDYTQNALIMTNSDQLEHIESIVAAVPYVSFHIAALTDMSSKLLNLSQYNNVKLFPTVDEDTIQALYEKCDVYLDINEGKEIVDALRKALDYDMLIMGYESIAHNRTVTAIENLFTKEDEAQALIQALHKIYKRRKVFNQRLQFQKEHINEVSVQLFNHKLKV
ncbi:accessory Sec system glycosylation chaperone GtfB [Staphylococcus succinus]|uniref:accessory Sec system glycosylation chaperone GtfB n=1 Tax=Staphylococcus succinus TaxID=61015 RepID=UPI000D1FCF38|nr:accessory Sec system glycosylation chaperone GtfB [Staphylococcus succinus]PTJ16605.1 accessory Sec system glycosylation chaperone GtfB [Staphylococcus succinus]RIN32259.1 accessory Sec system glycosylation chaperone GtfB [Staphylococcus succinus]